MEPVDMFTPAFPVDPVKQLLGMTLRDYFAAAALQGLIATESTVGWSYDKIVGDAYTVADAMMERRGVS